MSQENIADLETSEGMGSLADFLRECCVAAAEEEGLEVDLSQVDFNGIGENLVGKIEEMQSRQ